MVQPYAIIIAEIILYSNGFTDARNLAYKTTRLFELLCEQLKYCSHYDFGLRTLKAILVAAGKMKLRAVRVLSNEELALNQANEHFADHLGNMRRLHRER